jgi:hypothetical protein
VGSEQSDAPGVPAGPSLPDAASVDRPAADASAPANRGGLAGPLLVYTALRLGLIAVLTAVLALFMPLIVALLFAIIVQLPLAYVLFPGPRKRVNAAMAAVSAHRRAERERLRAALAGEAPPPDRRIG